MLQRRVNFMKHSWVYLYTSAIMPAICSLSWLSVLPLSMDNLKLRAYSRNFDFKMLFKRELRDRG